MQNWLYDDSKPLYISKKQLIQTTGKTRQRIEQIVSKHAINSFTSNKNKKEKYYKIDDLKDVFPGHWVNIEKNAVSISVDNAVSTVSDVEVKNEKEYKDKNTEDPNKYKTKEDLKNFEVIMPKTKEIDDYEDDEDYIDGYVSKDKKTSDSEKFTKEEIELLSNQYDVAVEDVLSFLSSIEGKKSLKYDFAKEHFENIKKDRKITKLQNIIAVDIPVMPSSVPSVPSVPVMARSGNNGNSNDDDEDITYQRKIAAAWGPFMLMKNFNSEPSDSGVKKEIEDLKKSNDDLKNLLYSVVSSQNKPKEDKDFVQQMTGFLELFKGVKSIVSESEDERIKKEAEATHRLEIQANKEKVERMLNVIQNYGHQPEQDQEENEQVSVYRSTDSKFNDMFNRKKNKK